MPKDLKYGQVTLELGDVGEDEPVIVFRARDMLLPEMLYGYATACEEAGSSTFHVEAIDKARKRVADWQSEHPELVRVPMSAGYQARAEGREVR